MNPLISENERL